MGRVKGTIIKRATKEFLLKYKGFSTNFEENKKIVEKYIKQKKFRNSIAGYITRIMRRKKRESKRNNSC